MQEALFVIDKIPGPSSFDVIRKFRKISGERKVGHSGSLDPFASGVLVLLVGRATKLSQFLLNADKKYYATVELGKATDSMDRTGNVTETAPTEHIQLSDVERVLKGFEGTWDQTPPMHSAKKINGVRLYELARKNISVPRASIPVELFSIELLHFSRPFIEFTVHCSKGTYIRSLADEIGRRLGSVAHLTELRRTACGQFDISEAVTLEQLEKDFENFGPQGRRNFYKLLKDLPLGTIGQSPAASGLH